MTRKIRVGKRTHRAVSRVGLASFKLTVKEAKLGTAIAKRIAPTKKLRLKAARLNKTFKLADKQLKTVTPKQYARMVKKLA